MVSSNVVMSGSYNVGLVALSVLISIFASHCFIDLARGVTSARAWYRSGWLGGGAVALGIGIWAVHFTGMLAFSLPVPIRYHWPTVLASLLIAVLASAAALYVVSRQRISVAEILTSGIFIGCGITGLHYTAMAAMRSSASCHYNIFLVALSALLGILFSIAAIWLGFYFRNEEIGTVSQRVASAVLLGAAISSMHYTAMVSATFAASASAPDISHSVGVSTLGIAGIAVVAAIMLGTSVATSFVDRRFAAQTALLQLSDQDKLKAQALIDAIPQQIWSGTADGSIDLCNERWRSYMGLDVKEFQGEGWQSMLHPDDRDQVIGAWQDSVTTGTPYEQEERHRRADGQYRWFLSRGVPLRDADGQIVRWYGTNTDIEDLKQAGDELRRLSGRILRIQDEERRSIARDLHDSTVQNLAVLAALLTQLRDSMASTDRKSRKLVSESHALAEQAIREIRTLSYSLHPPMLEEAGLDDAIRVYVEGFTKRSGIRVDVEVSARFDRLNRDTELTLFRIAQESITNIQMHSGSLEAKIRLVRDPEKITLEVSDRGNSAFEGSGTKGGELPFRPGVGIASMRERVKMIGGRLEIENGATGTTVRATVPVHE